MRRVRKIAGVALAVIIMAVAVSCGKNGGKAGDADVVSPFASFRDIPGVTAEEIAAIEKLQQAVLQRHSLVFGTPQSTELFIGTDGKFGGYIARYCDWLTDLLGIRVTPEIFIFSEMMDKLTSGELDFGIVRDREELRKEYFITDAIGQRVIIMMRIRGSEGINTISTTRPPRYVFLQASSTYDMASAALASDTYEALFAADYEAGYAMLKSEEADALIEANIIEGAFEKYDDVYAENFLPLLFNPINMMTAKPELEPVISVVTKALQNGAMPYLIRLYDEGNRDYMKHRMSLHLSNKEREYIASHPVVPIVANYDNYPACFYNPREEKWQGFFFDILDEIAAITGLSFKLINKNNDEWPVIYEMIKKGEASLIASMTRTREREEFFIWPETAMQPDYFALISKSDYPDISIREIQNARVGMARSTVHSATFKEWFPTHAKTVEYENVDKALLALQHGEIDLLMSSQRRLMYVTHFLELPGYRANIVFDQPIPTISAFNKNEEVLCTIFDKALKVVDTRGIADRWMRKTYDYRVKVAEARLPWLVGAAIMSLAVLSLILIMFYRIRNEGKRLTALVKEKTSTISAIFDATPDLIFCKDSESRITECNKSMENYFDISKSDIIGKNDMEAFGIPQDLADKYIANDKKIFREKHTVIVEEFIPTSSGKNQLFETTKSPLIQNGEVTGLVVMSHDITQRRAMARQQAEAEAKARDADERARLMLDSTPLACTLIAVVDGNYTTIDCNREALNLFGVSTKQEYIERFVEFWPERQPDGQNSFEKSTQIFKQAFETGRATFEWMHTIGGEPMLAEVTLVQVEYGGEHVLAGYTRDLRALRAAEAKVQEADERVRLMNEVAEKNSLLAAILNATPDLIFVKDSDLRHTECNKALEDHFNMHKSEFIGKNDEEAFNIPADLVDGYSAQDKEVLAEKKITIVEGLIPAADGKVRLFETVKSPIIHDGKAIGLVGMSRDITQRKAAEESMNRQNLLMGTVNVAAAVLLVPETDGGVNAINRSMEMVCKSVDADRVYLWENVLKDDGKLYCKQVCKWMRPEYSMSEELIEFSYDDTMPAWKKLFFEGKGLNGPMDTLPENGLGFSPDYKLQSLLAVPLFLKGEMWGFVSFEDCHSSRFFPEADKHILRSWGLLVVGAIQRGKIMGDLEHAVAEAETANSAKSAFLASMSHEIRTPLNAILGITEIQLQNGELSEGTKNALNIVYNSGYTLLGIINDLLDLSKIEAGKLELINNRYETASLINDTININAARIGSKPIEFKLEVDENLPFELIGDELRVKQILNNLLSNAFKYTDAGEVRLSVTAEVNGEDSRGIILTIIVSDTGQGMTEEQEKAMFDTYSRFNMETNRFVEGTGLGMNIVRNLVEKMDGDISVSSVPGKGTKIIVQLTQGYSSPERLGSELAENLRGFRLSGMSKMKKVQMTREHMPYGKVLVVDDMETNLYVAKGFLLPYDLTIDTALSGKEAIEKIDRGKVYDIVFMDHMMPGMDGIETVKAIREKGYTHPIVALTANAVMGQADKFMANGFDGFISKPIDIRELNASLNKFVRDRQPPEVVEAARAAYGGVVTGGEQSRTDPELAKVFTRDAEKAMAVLQGYEGSYESGNLKAYITNVHALKSALANIGETGLSGVAKDLEQAGRDGNTAFIADGTPAFMKGLRELVDKLKPETDGAGSATEEDLTYLRKTLSTVRDACAGYDIDAADTALKELKQRPWPSPYGELLDTISEHLLHSDFDEAEAVCSSFLHDGREANK